MVHYNLLIKGRVQGVYYRASAKQAAEKLGVSGFVLNQPDGSVYLEAEGDKQQLNLLIEWCKKGPAGARVDDVQITTAAIAGFKGFEIRRG